MSKERVAGGWWNALKHWWVSATREALQADEEQASQRSRGTVPIKEVQARQQVSISGVLQSITYAPLDAPARLVATLYDGTGTIEIRWPGRRSIPGISVGQHLELRGTVTLQRDHLAIVDPLYRLLGKA